MIVVDTDTLTLMMREDAPLRRKLLDRLADTGPDDLATTIVTYVEQTRGWMKYKARAKNITRETESYSRLKKHLDNYRTLAILDFDVPAAAEFQRLRKLKIRIGTMDLKIASIVKVQDSTLFSRNLVDFKKVPGLKVEDWSS
jgi:tRNA(fMet)-specific endonuclease VapC